jgi:hypothetical protein
MRITGAELLWRCPHPERHKNGDSNPSLKINSKKNIWACFVCGEKGTPWALAAFIAGLDPREKRPVKAWLIERGLLAGERGNKSQKAKRTDAVRRRLLATYEHRDSHGNPVARMLRFEPKDFSWQRWSGNNWLDGLGSVKVPLYRSPEIVGEPFVLVTEGQKDADAGAAIGFATTTSGGTGTFRADHADALREKDICILADADEAGRDHAQKVAQCLYGKARTVKMLELPDAKDLFEWIERGGTKESLQELIQNREEWKLPSISCGSLLDAILAFIRRFVALSDSQARVLALWVAHTHAFAAADATPYLAITPAEKQSGKSRLLEVLEIVVANPWFTGRVTPAVLIRKIDSDQPTLLLDESDAAFNSEKEYAEALRGVLNTGHRRGGKASCCVGQGANITFRDFSTFSPKAIAGIGRLPDTVADRSIPIRLKRAIACERVERFRHRNADSAAAELRGRLKAWSAAEEKSLRDSLPLLPEQLTDRQQDGAEPLLAIADLAGGEWPLEARRAVVQLCAGTQVTESVGVTLLSDIRGIFQEREANRLSSAELAGALAQIETSPWGEWSNGKPLTASRLARLLKPYEISPQCIRQGDHTLRGYLFEQFEDAFQRYLRRDTLSLSPGGHVQSATPQQTGILAAINSFAECNNETDVAVVVAGKPNKDQASCTVAFSAPQEDAKGIEEDL